MSGQNPFDLAAEPLATDVQLCKLTILCVERCQVLPGPDLDAHRTSFLKLNRLEAFDLINEWEILPKTADAPKMMYDMLSEAQAAATVPQVATAQLPTPQVQPTAASGATVIPSPVQGLAQKPPREMLAKFNSDCPACKGRINVGTPILYRPGMAATHRACGDPDKARTIGKPSSSVASSGTTQHVGGIAVDVAVPTQPAVPKVPLPEPGYYALQVQEPNGEMIWKFYRVAENRSGYRHMTRMSGDNQVNVTQEEKAMMSIVINADPHTRMADYGKQIGRCGMCHRTLTDPESIARGIGPDCWTRFHG